MNDYFNQTLNSKNPTEAMPMLTFFASIKQKMRAYPIRHFIIKLYKLSGFEVCFITQSF